ncbi:hypothetical protein [Synechocystis sp. LKSZ1]|uniref:hypothetical protein n=1 Tax=Synechocystis sp. LKSZ1 TaxID=3144951 RepID=UPI00336BC7D1
MKTFLLVLALLSGILGLTSPSQAQSVNQNRQSFFETGRLRSDDTLWFRSPPDGIIPTRERSNAWQLVVFRQGGVSFWMPPGVLSREDVALTTSLGDLNFQTLDSSQADRRYVAGYAPNLTPQQVKNPLILLDALQQKVAPSDQFKLTNNRRVNLDQYPGRELTFRSAEETIIFRAYLVQDRAYVIGIRFTGSDQQERASRAFLNGLQLLP